MDGRGRGERGAGHRTPAHGVGRLLARSAGAAQAGCTHYGHTYRGSSYYSHNCHGCTHYPLVPWLYLVWQERLEASERLATRREAGEWQTDLEWTLLKRLNVDDAGTDGLTGELRAAPALRTPAQAAEAREARGAREARRQSFLKQQRERERAASAEAARRAETRQAAETVNQGVLRRAVSQARASRGEAAATARREAAVRAAAEVATRSETAAAATAAALGMAAAEAKRRRKDAPPKSEPLPNRKQPLGRKHLRRCGGCVQ